jgi:outer membrane immunogenic protein
MRTVFFVNVALVALLTIPMAARAADMHVKAPPPAAPQPPLFSWTGFYLGGNVGAAVRRRDVNDDRFDLDFDNENNNAVFIGGGQLGANYQFDNSVVLGFEGDFDWVGRNNASDQVFVRPTLGTFHMTSNDNNKFVATVAARLGVAAYDRWLFYVKGGGGWVGEHDFTITNVTTGLSMSSSNGATNSGWLVGGGFEWAFATNWSGKLEYDFLGLTDRTFIVPTGPLAGDTFTTHDRNLQMVKFGFNYRFEWTGPAPAPIMTRY